MSSIAKKNIVVENNLILESSGHFKYENYINFLSEIGYARVSTVNHLGEFSVKGDIIDIFPSEFKEPVRLSIFGDTIESINTFDLKTKLNKDTLNRVVVKPHDEKNFNKRKREISANTFLTDISSFDIDDLIVHVDHGIGQFQGLKTLNILDSDHDCIEIRYQNSDKLFIPVENIELLSKYGGSLIVELDRLGASSWQLRKANAKNKIKDIAGTLIQTAAERELRSAKKFKTQEPYYSNFVNEFEHDETEDQNRSISDILHDLNRGVPMDRLICGDVGYGKTEVAVRAAFNVALSGYQVAILVPTTLLCRQHFETFTKRFTNTPIKIRQISRLVKTKDAKNTIEEVNNGEVDIIIGTHALLSEKIKFNNLGMLILDEEQHFGVTQKEKIKKIKSDIHVLSLTATPIPRTLEMSLVGLRELSIISTSPVNRKDIITDVMNFDSSAISEAIKKEIERKGQIFIVCPRISDIAEVEDFLKSYCSGVKYKIANGQMKAEDLEDVMMEFYNNEFSVLLSTSIIESGLDISTANTIIIIKADKFGTSQLHQLRGRVGRSNTEAFCYYTVPDLDLITDNASKRLDLLKRLNSLGSGFQLASHDLDLRGSGNIIGDEQSGHIREIGLELYHRLLREKISDLKNEDSLSNDSEWSPQINLGLTVLIPEKYMPNLNSRLHYYKKLAYALDKSELSFISDDIKNQYGELPESIEHLLKITNLRISCKSLNIEKIEMGQKGAVIKFRKNRFDKIPELISLIARNGDKIKMRQDESVVYKFFSNDKANNIKEITDFIGELEEL